MQPLQNPVRWILNCRWQGQNIQAFELKEPDSLRGARVDMDQPGIGGVWLMPIGPSSTYHKYNVDDYYDVHPGYGILDDF
jgi:hypothetical protein